MGRPFVDPVVAGDAHFYPLYLGGSYDQPLYELNSEQHTAAHNVLRKHGLSRQPGVSYDAARAAWQKLPLEKQQAIITESMRAAGIPESLIKKDIDKIMADVPSKRMSYSQILGKVLLPARMKFELRADDAGQPFIWITSLKPVR